MSRLVKAGATDQTVTVRVVDSADGTPETGVVYNTAGAAFWYKRGATGAKTAISLATQTDTGAHTDGGFVHVSDGYCRLDLPDAAVAAGVDEVSIGGTFTDMVVIGTTVQLIAYNPRTENAPANVLAISDDTVAADNLEAAADGAGYNLGGGAVVAASVTGAVGSVTGNVGGNVTGSVGSLATQAKADVNAEADTAISDAALATAVAVAALPSAASIATAVWASGARTLTSFGTLAADTATAVWASGTRTLTSFGTLVADIWAGVTTAARNAIADTVWDELLSGHAVSGSAGATLSAASAPSASTIATAVWANLTRTLTSSGALSQDDIDDIVAAISAAAAADSITVTGNDLSRKRGDRWSIEITGMGDISDRAKLWFTVKTTDRDADSKSVLQVEETAQLLYIAGGSAATAANAALTVDDESAGDITITVEAPETAKIGPLSEAVYDVQVLRDDDSVDTLRSANFTITADVTRATS